MEGRKNEKSHAGQRQTAHQWTPKNALDGRPNRGRVDAVSEADHDQTNHRRQHGETEQGVRTAEHGGRDEQQHGAVAGQARGEWGWQRGRHEIKVQ